MADHPHLAACLLEQCGVTLDDFEMAVWADEMADEPDYYRPLVAS